MFSFPMNRIRRQFATPTLQNIAETLQAELAPMAPRIPRSSRIAIAVGSRGIKDLQSVVKTVVEWVKAQGGDPFLIPAMGTHGGATAAGQKEILEGYGLTESQVGVPIRSSMEVVELPQGNLPHKVYYDRMASEADGTILINRVKPHTDFHGRYESGLVKMTVIGLGKQHQASQMHSLWVRGLREVIPQVAAQSLRVNNILFGVAIVENPRDETALLKVIPRESILEQEPPLLEMARSLMPSFPVEEFDVLFLDEIGKDISGVGMDPNLIGRLKITGEPEPESPRIKIIIIRGLTKATHGNATGMGLADIMTRSLYNQIDFKPTYHNMVTSGFLERAKLPLIAETDRQALEIALRGAGFVEPEKARIIRIKNTLHLDELQVSLPVLEEIRGRSDIQILGPIDSPFDETGTLKAF
jgi:hypothetical protein